jgi:hypothetical protein
MAISIDRLGAMALELQIDQKLEKDDYLEFTPLAEAKIAEFGNINLLIKLSDFNGWSPGAMWEDLKFDARHYSDVDRLALVSESESDEWMATVSKPFTSANVKHFLEEDLDRARRWVRGRDSQ